MNATITKGALASINAYENEERNYYRHNYTDNMTRKERDYWFLSMTRDEMLAEWDRVHRNAKRRTRYAARKEREQYENDWACEQLHEMGV